VYQGQVKKNKEALGLFGGDADMAANMANTVQAWIDKGKHAKLLELWVKGLSMDWGKLHGQSKPRRIAAPTYPFARQRYWIEGAAGADVPVSRNLSAPIVLPAQPSQATPLALFGRPADHVNHRQSDRPLPAIALSQASLSAPETAFTAARTSVTLSAQAEATQTMHSLSLTPKAIT
jgi:polyketide synthase PksL